MTRKLTLFAVAAATMLTATAPAMAQVNSMNEATSRVVRYDDLDLNNDRGRERLDRRLRSAANSVCGFWSAKALSEKRDADQCRKTAMEKVQPKVAAAVRNAAARYAARAD
jgi:UrcA family protein